MGRNSRREAPQSERSRCHHYFTNRDERAEHARTHTVRMEKEHHDEIVASCNSTEIFRIKVVNPFYEAERKDFRIDVMDTDSVSAVRICAGYPGKSAVLNFASFTNPGGMFLKGSSAQEEALCHESTLYNVISQFGDFYAVNQRRKNRHLYENAALYSPNIFFVPNVHCDVITCAAPNYYAASNYANVTAEENVRELESRIKFVLDIAQHNCVDNLVLGAFGCGVFGQDPAMVAKLFKKTLNENNYGFNRVVFAIPNSGRGAVNYQAFKAVFGN